MGGERPGARSRGAGWLANVHDTRSAGERTEVSKADSIGHFAAGQRVETAAGA